MLKAAWVLGVLSCAGGCGGVSSSDGSGGVTTCDEFTPCGGDIVGTWDIAESCIDEAGATPIADCPDSTYRYSEYEADGRYVFDANGEVTITYDVQFAYVWNVPRSCLGNLTCTEIEQALNMPLPTEGVSIVFQASCPEAPSVCRCDVSGSLAGTNVNTYTTSGSTLTLNTDDTESAQQYCVDGDTLGVRGEGGGFVLTRN